MRTGAIELCKSCLLVSTTFFCDYQAISLDANDFSKRISFGRKYFSSIWQPVHRTTIEINNYLFFFLLVAPVSERYENRLVGCAEIVSPKSIEDQMKTRPQYGRDTVCTN